jgi:hypothetical protein
MLTPKAINANRHMTLSAQHPEVDKTTCCVTGRTMFQTPIPFPTLQGTKIHYNIVFTGMNPESTEAGQTTSQFSVTTQKRHKFPLGGALDSYESPSKSEHCSRLEKTQITMRHCGRLE